MLNDRNRSDWLDDLVKRDRMTTEQALEICDMLPAVDIATIVGRWRGVEISTGHPFDGLLGPLGWYGKESIDRDNVHPLLFVDGDRIFSVNPKWMPPDLILNWPLARGKLARILFRAAGLLLQTTEAHACLRMLEYRGKVSAAMIYDTLPVIDAFRLVDHDTLFGVMEMRGMDKPFIFRLHRDRGG